MGRVVRSLALYLLLGLLAAVFVNAAQAIATPTQVAPRALHLTFHRMAGGWLNGHCGAAGIASHDWLIFSLSPDKTNRCASRFLVINDRTGKSALIDARPCRYAAFSAELEAFGAPWALFSCGNGEKLYNVTTRKWRSLGCDASCHGPYMVIDEAIGARWLQIDEQLPGSCGDGVHFDCGPVRRTFFNLLTHALRHRWPKTPTTILDLDSPALAHHLCKPLHAPATGSLTLEGDVAVITTTDASYVQRCGSRTQTLLLQSGASVAGGGLLANDDAILWKLNNPLTGVWHGQLNGVLLLTLERFTATVPPRIATSSSAMLLGADRLYVSGDHGGLWAARLPPDNSQH
jgi:hypothetical protein